LENLWAELPEAKRAPIEVSLALLDSLHQRWMLMLRELTDGEWKRTFPIPWRMSRACASDGVGEFIRVCAVHSIGSSQVWLSY